MTSRCILFGAMAAAFVVGELAVWAENDEQGTSPPASVRTEDVTEMLKQLQQRRADAWKRVETNWRMMEGRPGLTAAQINQDKGFVEAADWMMRDLKDLLNSNPPADQLRTRVAAIKAAWQQRRTEAWERVKTNWRFMEGGGRTGLTAAQINQDKGLCEAFDWALVDISKVLGEPAPNAASGTGPPSFTSKLTPEQILPLLPKGIITTGDLERFLEQNKAIGLTREAMDQVIELFQRQRSRQMMGLMARATRDLDKTPLTLSSQPSSPITWDPAAGAVSVVVSVDESALESTFDAIRGRVLQLAGSSPVFQVRYGWTGPDGKPIPTENSLRHTFPFREPKEFTVSVVRWVTMQCDVKGDDDVADELRDLVGTTFAARGVIALDVKPLAFPEEIAGIWSGNLVIREMPAMDALAAKMAAEPPRGPSDADDPLAGCEIPPEAFKLLVTKLKAAKGLPLPLSADFQNDPSAGGTMMMTVTPPSEWGTGRGNPVKLAYRYSNGVVTAQLRQRENRMQMRATLVPAARGWTLTGTWTMDYLDQGRWTQAMTGTWTASNPQVK